MTLPPKTSAADTGTQADREMAEYGITRVSHDYFHCGEFRYTNLNDAIEQAKRLQLRASGKK